jgi:hypothetical protein
LPDGPTLWVGAEAFEAADERVLVQDLTGRRTQRWWEDYERTGRRSSAGEQVNPADSAPFCIARDALLLADTQACLAGMRRAYSSVII